jgi:hypothetical protein
MRKKLQIEKTRTGTTGPRLTDLEVEAMRSMHEAGWGYKRLAAKFEVPVATVQGICTMRRRGYAGGRG